ncbi:MAG TPA: PDR/VanB family oxidoreductase [Citricoccus sp.]
MTVDSLPRQAAPLDDPFAVRELLIRDVSLEADRVLSIRLADLEGADLPAWQPGAHLDVILPSGKVRQFSLCGDPADRSSYTVAVLREAEGRGGSVEIHDFAIPGRTLQVRGPRNHFELSPAEEYVFVAGGIGITPILPMIRQAVSEKVRWHLAYAGRSRRNMAFLDELEALARDGLGEVELFPRDEGVRLDVPSLVAALPETATVYCCGPSSLIDQVQQCCTLSGSGPSLHVERFTSGEASAEARAQVAESAGTFEVVLARSGASAVAGPGCTVLDAIRELAPDVLTDCEEGYCGTCETKVLEGEPEHHDTILTEKDRAKNNCMMICVGRARSERLVLDL